MKFGKGKKVGYDDERFAKRVDEIFRAKWRRAVNEGNLITRSMADQIRQEAIKQVKREYGDMESGYFYL